MALQKYLKTLKTLKTSHPRSLDLCPKPYQAIADIISKNLSSSVPKPLNTIATTDAASFLSCLNPTTLLHILTDPELKSKKCLRFFNFLLRNQSLVSFEPDLQAYFTLICRLVRERRFSDAEKTLKSVSVGEKPRYPFSVIAPTVGNCCCDPKVVSRLFNSMLKIYSDCNMFNVVSEVFEYMKNNGIGIDERTCTVHLLALRRSGHMRLALDFFYRMVESGIEVSVFSLTIVVECLYRGGEVKRGRELVEEMIGRGIKPNIITFNIMADTCAKARYFGELDMVLHLMDKEGLAFNDRTYKILIDGFTSFGKVDEAKRLGSMDSAVSMFDEMMKRSILPDADTYWALISSLCKFEEMGMAMAYVNDMHSKGLELDSIMFNTLIDGFCNQRMVDEAFQLQGLMGKKGFIADFIKYFNRSSTSRQIYKQKIKGRKKTNFR